MYLVERLERSVLAEIEMLAVGWLTELFPAESDTGNPLAEAEAQAATLLLEQTEEMIRRQTDNWEQSVEQLRSRWVESFERHQTALDESLQSGLEATLESHGRQLSEAREVLVEGVRSSGEQVVRSLAMAQEKHQQLSSELTEQNARVLSAVQSELASARDHHRQFSTEWQQQLQAWQSSMAGQTEAQQQLALSWAKLAGDQNQLAAVEAKLAENLQVAQAADSLNETLHSLNAAVHLLTARARPAA